VITSSPVRSARNRGRWPAQADASVNAGRRWFDHRSIHDVVHVVVIVIAACLAAVGISACSAPAPKDTPADSSRTTVKPVGNATRGLALLTAFKDSLPENSGNGLRCTSCHLDNGTRATALPWLGTAARYPRYRSRRGSEESLEQRVNDCIARSLAGQMLPEDSPHMRDIIAYLDSLGSHPRPASPDSIKLAGNAVSGKQVWTESCARCHGALGEGLIAPAMWGENSFAIGAGMARQIMFATFVRANMPYDKMGSTTPQQAADVAAYVLSLPRPDHPGKERDWPKGDPPVDVAYETDAARAAGKPMPPRRPVLPRRVQPMPATQRARGS
jgi:thiosulfate dehydrogenase